jgi:hypothetical protein
MSTVSKATAKSYFETGDTPTQAQFGDLIDSTLFPDEQNIPLKEYTTTTPAAPGSGSIAFSRKRAGRSLPATIGIAGKAFALQPAFFTNRIAMAVARGGSITTLDPWGLNITGNTASAAASTAFNGNLFSSIRRVTFPSTASAGSIAGVRNNSLQWSLGDAAGKGGFFFVLRGGASVFSSDMRGFIGFSGSAATMSNADPSGFTNLIAFAFDAADTNWKFMHNDGSGACTVVDLGASFPCKTTAIDFYEFRLYAAPNTSVVYYSLERINTGDFIEGSVNTNLPAATQGLSYQAAMTNNATASIISFDISSIYIETDN